MVQDTSTLVLEVKGTEGIRILKRFTKALGGMDKQTTKAKKGLLGLQRPTLILSNRFGVLRLASLGVAGALLGMISIGIGRFLKNSVKSFMEVERSMKRVSAIAGATSKEFRKLMKTAVEMGRATVFTVKEAADAMIFLAMAGLSVKEIMGAISVTLDLAAASASNLARTAAIVTNIMPGFRL